MAWKETMVMVVMAIVLGAVAFLSMDLADDSPKAGPSGPLLDRETFPISDFNRIELTRGDEHWLFVREGDEWWQLEPFRAPIEGRNLMAVAERAVDLQVVDRFIPDDDLSLESLSLDSPEAMMTFGWDGGSRGFRFGRRGVAGRGYLQLDDDPQVLVIGEIRDEETAAMALRASMTGHLVIATLHAGSCRGVIERINTLTRDSHLVAGQLQLILNQRLVRRGCVDCSGKGCSECFGSGLRGRVPFLEMLRLGEAEREAVEAKRLAKLEPTFTFEQSSAHLLGQALTTESELKRHTL